MDGWTTARLELELIEPGQAQKETSHNEALALLDIAVQASVTGVGRQTPPPDPAPGVCWIVGNAPGGAWAGHAHALAGWTDGGWRFVAAREGMAAWSLADGVPVRFRDGAWRTGELTAASVAIGGVPVVRARRPAIADPAGAGGDAEARAAIAAILDALRQHGLIATT